MKNIQPVLGKKQAYDCIQTKILDTKCINEINTIYVLYQIRQLTYLTLKVTILKVYVIFKRVY